MKDHTTHFFAFLFLMISGLGCSFISDTGSTPSNGANSVANSANRSLSDKAIDSTVGRSKVGVPECDEVLDAIEAELNNPDDNFVVKAAKTAVLNQIKDGIRQGIEENANKSDMVTTCREFKAQFERYKAEQQKNAVNQ